MVTLVSVDTTPNPNSMKLNLSNTLGVSGTFTRENDASTPEILKQLLGIQGVVSIYCAASFLTVNRDPRTEWESILNEARRLLEGKEQQALSVDAQRLAAEHQGQVNVLVQTFRQVPIQVKVSDGVTEERVGLPPRFGDAARELQTHFGTDYLKERYWADWGVRYGALKEVAQEICEEIENLLDEAQLNQQKMLAMANNPEPALPEKNSLLRMDSANWHERLQAVQQLEASETNLLFFVKALQDEKPQIRRWAAAKLAGVQSIQSIEALGQALLSDVNVGVRRTAGDSLSDIGDPLAQGAICQALSDKNKLVRWRAARFLAETGTKEALPYLEKLKEDPEFEVRLEVEAAIQHITEGSKAALPVWKLISQDS